MSGRWGLLVKHPGLAGWRVAQAPPLRCSAGGEYSSIVPLCYIVLDQAFVIASSLYHFVPRFWLKKLLLGMSYAAMPAALGACPSLDRIVGQELWVCLKIGYIPNYSHLIGIMIINHWL